MPSLFLRLLLCVALLFNGMGSAMASAHLAAMGLQAEAAAEVQAEAQAVDGECPHAARTAAAVHGAGSDHGDRSDAAAMPPASADTDCYERCLDLCMQHCQALIGGLTALDAPLPGAGAAVPLAEGQGSPLPHPLLRPPIGA